MKIFGSLLVSILSLLVMAGQSAAAAPGSWEGFKEQFISAEGRVIDFFQQGISHSEGQGYAMLLGVGADDQPTFDRLWQWTRRHLQVRKTDALHAWSWGRRINGEQAVVDYNNASDGDICIAWALLLARERWNRGEYGDEAVKIMGSIRRHLLVEQYGRTFLLPGYYGFGRGEDLVINPSYLVFPALRLFAEHGDRTLWNRVHDDMLSLLEEKGFGRWQLPADWLLVQREGVTMFPDKPPIFGYEAIRVLLWMSWDRSRKPLSGMKLLLDALAAGAQMPISIDLAEDQFAEEGASAGFLGVVANSAARLGRKKQAAELWQKAEQQIVQEEGNYYSQVLYLLARSRRKQ
ncbi:MAG: glycosyl hydrolase family 8 [Thermodesulfobacteriota bacterium]